MGVGTGFRVVRVVREVKPKPSDCRCSSCRGENELEGVLRWRDVAVLEDATDIPRDIGKRLSTAADDDKLISSESDRRKGDGKLRCSDKFKFTILQHHVHDHPSAQLLLVEYPLDT